MNVMKRVLSLLLSMALLVSYVPAVAFAEGTEIPAETEIVAAEETLAPTEAAAEPATEPAAEETIAPTQPAVPEETAAPTEVEADLLEGTVPGEDALASTSSDVIASGTCGDNLTWMLDTEGTLTISGSGDMYNYCEDAPWQEYADDIKKVVIDEGVTSIGDYAIWCYFNLTNVTIPSTVTSIGTMGFAGCTEMGNVTLPENLTSIGEAAFVECHGMTELVIPGGVTEIGIAAFAGCVGLTKITFQGDSPIIWDETFGSVTATAYYPANNPTWTADVMQDYGGTITWKAYGEVEDETTEPTEDPEASEDSETVWLEGDNSCYVNNYAYLELCGTTASEVTWTLSDPNVAMIYYSDATCLWLYGLSAGTVTVTATTESGLTASFEVTVMGTPTSGTCGDDLTWNLDDEGTLTISGTGEMTSRPWRTSYSRQIKNIVIGNGVTSIYRGAFWGCRNITELAIPASVTSIGEEAFIDCYDLQSFSVDPANTAFCASEGVLFNADMTKLVAYPAGKTENYTIPATVETIGYKAFDSAKIEQLTIPASVTTLENYAFNGDISFYVDANSSAFASGSAGELYSKDKTVLYRYCAKQAGETYTVADGVVTIANGAFEGNISKVVFPDSVQTIGGWAFNGMGTLESVTFGTGLKEIDDCAFQTCTGLKTIYFTGDAPTFSEDAFNDHVIATAYYPADNATWTADVMRNYGYDSTITWEAYTPGESGGDEPAETEPAEDENIIDSGTCGEKLTWKLDKEGTLTISGTGDMKDWTGENQCWGNYSYEGIKTIVVEEGVTSIGNYAFASIKCQSVELPSTLTSIGDYAFWMCYSLNSVNIPENVTTIGENAFCNCIKLESVVIPDSVTSIGKYAFRWCYALQSLELPDSITVIEDEAFYDCESLTTIVIPDSVISIGADAFHSCKALTNITIPDGVTTLGRGAFDGCTSLTNIKIPASITDIPLNAFNECSGLTSVEIPDGVTSIGMAAFWGCSSLTCITLPDSLTSIDVSSFEGCTSLKKIVFMGDAPKYKLSVFSNLTVTACYPADNDTWTSDVMQTYGGALTWVPYTPGESGEDENVVASGTCGENLTWKLDDEGTLTISGTGAMKDYNSFTARAPWFSNRSLIKSVVIETGVTSIGNYAFYNSKSLTNIVIPNNVTSIGNAAFYECSSLTSITIPDSVTSIGASAFYYCSNLTSIEIPDGVTSIGGSAFYDCDSLTSIEIPDSVTSIGGSTFSSCDSLTNVTIGNGVSSIGDSAFFSCRNLKSITIPDSVTSIGYRAFAYCNSLTSVTIGSGVTGMGGYSFYYCGNLTSVTILDGATSIGDFGTFAYCSSLTSVTIGNGVTSISKQTFMHCSSLTSIEIPDSVTSIGEDAFFSCDSLTSVTIPDGVTSIYNAFGSCDKLTDIYYGGTSDQWSALRPRPSASYIHYTCTDAENHWIAVSVESDCVNAGYTCDACSCGYERNKVITGSALGHDMGAWVVTKEATCTEDGEQNRVCSRCHKSESETIATSGHNYVDGICMDCGGIEETATSGTCGANLTWTLDKEGALTISGTGDMTRYSWDETPWQSRCDQIKTITIQDGVTSIGDYAFNRCCDLTAIDIPDSVIDIRYGAFYGCSSLTSIDLPGGLTGIASSLFEGCTSLTSVVIPAGVTTIYSFAFQGCLSMKEVTFEGDAPSDIGETAFLSVTATAFYPRGNATWTADVMQNYGGTITWVAYGEPQVLPKPVVTVAANEKTGGGMLSWEEVPEADSYRIYRATSKSGKYKLLETVEGTELEVKVSVGKTYYYKVKAICETDSSLNSSYSSVVKVTGKCAQPEINVTAKPSSGKPVVKWSKVSSAKKYDVYRATEIDGTYKKVKTTTSTSYNDTSAKVGTTYYYKVKAIASKSTYNSAYSEIESCLTILAQPDTELSINKTTGKPVIEWEKVSGAAGYEILRAESEKGEYTKLANQTELTYTDSTAEPDKDYWYKVNAISAEERLNSIDGDAEMIHAALAKPVVSFGVNSISGKPVMTWEEVDGAVEYKIYRSSKSKESYKSIATTTDLSYTDTSVKAGKGYYYKVIAIGENCKSSYSSYKKLTAKCAQPEITAIGADPASGKPAVKWNKVSGAEKYYVYRATEENGTYEKVKTTTSTSYTDTSAKVGTTYYYKVKAVASKSTYNSIYSEVESCLTGLARPVVTAKNDANTGKVILTWEKVSGAVAYEVYRVGEDGILCLMCTQWELTFTDEGEGTEVDTVYTYTVKAIAEDTELNSAESAAVTTSAACEKPKASIELSSKKPSISWDSVEGATKYYVYRSTKSGSGYKKIATVDLEDGTSYRDSKAKKGTTYYYKVVAVSENAKSAYSNTVKIKSK